RAELANVANQSIVSKHRAELLRWQAHAENGGIAVQHRRDGRVQRVVRASLRRQRLHSRVVSRVAAHQDVRESDFQPRGAHEANAFQSARKRARQLGDGIVDFRLVRVDADQYLLDARLAQAPRFFFTDEHGIRFELHVETEFAGEFDDLKAVAAQERFAAADRKEEDAGLGELRKKVANLGGGQLVFPIVFEVA